MPLTSGGLKPGVRDTIVPGKGKFKRLCGSICAAIGVGGTITLKTNVKATNADKI